MTFRLVAFIFATWIGATKSTWACEDALRGFGPPLAVEAPSPERAVTDYLRAKAPGLAIERVISATDDGETWTIVVGIGGPEPGDLTWTVVDRDEDVYEIEPR